MFFYGCAGSNYGLLIGVMIIVVVKVGVVDVGKNDEFNKNNFVASMLTKPVPVADLEDIKVPVKLYFDSVPPHNLNMYDPSHITAQPALQLKDRIWWKVN